MKKIVNTLINIVVLLMLPAVLLAQNDASIEMADTFRSEGKIYVVILVITIVFTGLVIFAFRSDRKIAKLEKEVESLKSNKG